MIAGRKTWQTMDQLTSKPFPNSINIVLSKDHKVEEEVKKYKNTIKCSSLEEAIQKIKENIKNIDQVWVFGGAQTYKTAIESKYFYRLYLSHIYKSYDCDSYFPEDIKLQDSVRIKLLTYNEINNENVPNGIQTDEKTGVKFEVKVYQNKDT
ncbi:dihydrofolate reductase-like isoform X2 [Lycorma delicatula]